MGIKFNSFDDLFDATYQMYSLAGNVKLKSEHKNTLKEDCKSLVVGFDMDTIQELFSMHLRKETTMITPIDLQVYIMCLQDVGQLPPIQ